MSFKSHNYAIEIEHIVSDVFNCQRFGFGGIVNSDFIERSAYTAIASALATYYMKTNRDNQKKIEDYLNKYSYYSDMSLENIIDEFKETEVKLLISEFESLLKILN